MKNQAISVAILLALLVNVSCGASEISEQTSAVSDDTTAAPETTYNSLPPLDFGGETVTMFVRTEDSQKPEFYVEEQSGELVNDAIYNRNRTVEERLNVSFEYVENTSDYSTRQDWPALISQSILANDSAYDIAAGYSMAMANLAAASMLVDMKSTEYLDFSQPWWSDSLLEESLVNGKLYFASGDISTWMILYTYATLFNKELLADFGLEDPYTLVDEGKWTLDKMMEMSSGVYSDLNNNGKKDVDDRFGYASSFVYIDAFYFGADLRTTESTAEGVKLSPLFSSEKTVNLVEKLTTFLKSGNDGYAFNSNEGYYNFDKGNTLFQNIEIQYAYTTLRSADFDYGILPIPKYAEAQENYYTVTSFPYTLYGIPLDAKDADMSSAVIECLASESYRNVSPALFEVALKVKYSQDSNDARMYDIVKSSVVYDIGRIFNDNLGGKTYALFREAAIGNNTAGWSSICAAELPAIESMIEELFEQMK